MKLNILLGAFAVVGGLALAGCEDKGGGAATTTTGGGTGTASTTTTPAGGGGDASKMGDDDKHKLWQAAATTGDVEIIKKVNNKIGIADANGTPNDKYQPFATEHGNWAQKNTNFIMEINTPDKAKEYVKKSM